MNITITIDDDTAKCLSYLNDDHDVEQTIMRLIDHAHQGIYRPGSWERGWLEQVFFDEVVEGAEAAMYENGNEPKRGA